MSRYDWSKAPEWAQYAATDKSGKTYCFEREPVKSDIGPHWKNIGGRVQQLYLCDDWADSLEARPKPPMTDPDCVKAQPDPDCVKAQPEPTPAPARYDPAKCTPFDLDRALAGDPVCTAEGEPVSQLTKFGCGDYCLAGVLRGELSSWYESGKYYKEGEFNLDLRMAPKTRTVWVNFYKDAKAINSCCHNSEKRAIENASSDAIAIAIPVEIPA